MSGTESQNGQKPPAGAVNLPPVVSWLAGAMVAVHLLRLLIPRTTDYLLVEFLAFDASVYTDPGVRGAKPLAMFLGPATHIFVHADMIHLTLNVGLFLGFGTAIARRMGPSQFMLLFLLCGIAGAIAWLILNPLSPALLIGASGAISGMIGATARLGIDGKSAPGGPPPLRSRQQAMSLAIIWILLNLVIALAGGELFGLAGAVAWEAHLGGFVAGYLLIGRFNGRGRRHLGGSEQSM